MRGPLLFALAVASAMAPHVVAAQDSASHRLAIEATVARIVRRGDTLDVEYRVRSLSASVDSLWSFTVEVSPGTVGIDRPATGEWMTVNRWGDLPVARWTSLGTYLPPGANWPEMRFRSVGLPGIVPYYAEWHRPVPPYEPVDERYEPPVMSASENLSVNAVRGVVVGVVAFPASPEPGSLVERLRTLSLRACALGWIANDGVCRSLDAKLDAASRSLERGQTNPARNQLRALLAELEAQHGPQPGKHVNDNAYWLLKTNVEYLMAQLE